MVTPEFIKRLRRSMQLTTTQFASLLGVAANTIDRWERGDRHPRYETALKIEEIAARHAKTKRSRKAKA